MMVNTILTYSTLTLSLFFHQLTWAEPLDFTVETLPAVRLGSYTIEIQESSVSGISSGAYMADQFFVSHSKDMRGVGIFAGGPYGCADGNFLYALGRCMEPFPFNRIDTVVLDRLVAAGHNLADHGKIDPLENMSAKKVYIFSGTHDDTVSPEVTAWVKRWYTELGLSDENILYDDTIPASHGMPTMDYGNGCSIPGKPWIVDCDFDGAEKLLSHIYGPLQPRVGREELDGKFIKFHQNDFFTPADLSADELKDQFSMNEFGFAYIPESCLSGASCRVHVAFHGCQQVYNRNPEASDNNPDDAATPFGLQFVKYAGYNQWADTNNLIILYPQAQKSAAMNPRGCWDWWGYIPGTAEIYHTKHAPQIKAVFQMLKRLAGLPEAGCRQWTAPNREHALHLRAEKDWCFLFNVFPYTCYRSTGSGDILGSANTITTVKSIAGDTSFFTEGFCPQ